MSSRAWSSVLAGAALAAAFNLNASAPAVAAGREPSGNEIWSLAAPWLGDLWSHATAAIGWGIDPNGSPTQDAAGSDPSGDISWGLDPDG